MIENIYKQICMELETLYAHAVIHESTGDSKEYLPCLDKLAQIAEILGVKTELKVVQFGLKQKDNADQ